MTTEMASRFADRPRTLGQLKASGYQSRPIKEEMRTNLIAKLRRGEPLFPGIVGYEETVFPQIVNGILSRHDLLFLGLRGQAKTRMLRRLVDLLDEAIPIVAGSEVNDDPSRPLSAYARQLIRDHGDDTPIEWIGRDRRYLEKLATPDVSIADLIGEIDMIKVAEGRYLSNENVIHYGLIPRANRGIFCVNELPDLAPRIQVGLFNVLEERDLQIRGFPIRLELDVCMVFSANPEDYTNRGRIVTPLKDRIGTVVRTHYPLTRELGIRINDENAYLDRPEGPALVIPHFIKELIEETSRLARTSPHINQQSGVSTRMSIANLENIVSNAERRALVHHENVILPRPSDTNHLAPGSRGKLELLMAEDDTQEDLLILRLRDEALKVVFDQHISVKSLKPIVEWFDAGGTLELGDMVPSQEGAARIAHVPPLAQMVETLLERLIPEAVGRPSDQGGDAARVAVAELLLDGLHVHNRLNRSPKNSGQFYRS